MAFINVNTLWPHIWSDTHTKSYPPVNLGEIRGCQMNHGGANGKSSMARGHKALAINWGHLLLGAGLVICRIPVSHQSPSTVICAKSQWVRRTITQYRGFTRMIYFCWTWVSSQQSLCHAQILLDCFVMHSIFISCTNQGKEDRYRTSILFSYQDLLRGHH